MDRWKDRLGQGPGDFPEQAAAEAPSFSSGVILFLTRHLLIETVPFLALPSAILGPDLLSLESTSKQSSLSVVEIWRVNTHCLGTPALYSREY